MSQTIREQSIELPVHRQVSNHLFPFHRILAAIDKDCTGSWAASAAMNLADQFGCDLGLVHVVTPCGGSGTCGKANACRGKACAEGQAFLKRHGARAPADHALERFLREGEPAAQILASADDWNADLLVMGTHSRRGLTRLLLGSVAADVIRASPKPVLCMSGPLDGPMGERILVAIDDDDNTKAVLEWAGMLASPWGSTVQLLHTVPVPAPGGASCVFDDNDAILSVRHTAFEFLDAQHPTCPANTRVLRELRHGTAATEIVNLANAWKADLIIIGSSASSRLAQFVLGGTTDAVLRRAQCPVLCVRQQTAV